MLDIREMTEADREAVLDMMRVFYASPAVLSNGSEEIFRNDVDSCIGDSPYLEGCVLVDGEQVVGYGMLAKSFSTEFGKPCIWAEDLYVKPEYRSCGAGSMFFAYVDQKYPEHVKRLEVEKENARAIALYKRRGYEVLPYMEMIKDKQL